MSKRQNAERFDLINNAVTSHFFDINRRQESVTLHLDEKSETEVKCKLNNAGSF